MKKIYITLVTSFFCSQGLQAQLTLLKSTHEPVAGDKYSLVYYDSTAAVPKNTGLNQTWNFSSLVQNTTSVYSATFVTASSLPSSSLCPGATLAETNDQGSATFYKSPTSPSQMEVLGFYDPSISYQYTNTMVQVLWPTTYGTTFNDNFSGPMSGFITASIQGINSSTASGTGILILPGGASFSNVLQIKTVQTTTLVISSPIVTTQVTQATNYVYFHSSNKIPLLSVYFDGNEFQSASINKLVAVGLNDYNFDASYAIYPNPAKNTFHVKLSNTSSEACLVEIYNATGQLVKQYDLGNSPEIETAVAIHDLSPGVYQVKTSLGQKTSARRLIVE